MRIRNINRFSVDISWIKIITILSKDLWLSDLSLIKGNLLKKIKQKYNVKSNFSKLFLQIFFDGKYISNVSSIQK